MNGVAGAVEAVFGDAVMRGLAAMPIVPAILDGTLERDALRRYAARYYAELRTFIDVKIPERLRLCPHGAARAKAFFARAYAEEQGQFRLGEDHASVFGRVCRALDLTTEELEEETKRYAARFRYLRDLEPSWRAMVRELAIAYAWESAAPVLGMAIASALEWHYAVPAEALRFFSLHAAADRAHSAEALQVLLAYADGPELVAVALAAIDETLHLEHYFRDP
jgi:pyrroloquinoline quinone (PQQ) biosynthesis protein C